MSDYIILTIVIVLGVIPLAVFVGYKLGKRISNERKFAVGFAITVSMLTIILFLKQAFPWFDKPYQMIATAIALGFPGGIALPYNKTQK